MRRFLRLTTWPLVLVALLLISRTRAAGAPPPMDGAQADCAFSNPAWSGWCRQTVPIAKGKTAKKACQAVLNCLNNNACASNYCNAADIRFGWRLEEAKAHPRPTPRP
jgi:hypothetical protein